MESPVEDFRREIVKEVTSEVLILLSEGLKRLTEVDFRQENSVSPIYHVVDVLDNSIAVTNNGHSAYW